MPEITPEYLFYFQDYDSADKKITKLKYDPDGWKEYGVNFGRETGISNVVKSYTGSWRFVKDDAAYIKGKLFAYGVNRRIRLIIKHLKDIFTETYETEYTGYLDLTQISIESSWVSVPVSEGGFFKALENRWSEDYRMQLDSICNVNGASFAETTTMLNEGEIAGQPCTANSCIGYILLGGRIQESEGVSGDFFKDTGPRFLNATFNAWTGVDTFLDGVTEDDAFFVVRSGVIQGMSVEFDAKMSLTITNLYTYAQRHRTRYELYLVSTDYANVQNGASLVFQRSVNADFIQMQYVQETKTLANGLATSTIQLAFAGEKTINDYDCSGGKAFFLLARLYYGDPDAAEIWGNGVGYSWDNRYPATVGTNSTVSLKYQRYRVVCSFESQININKRVSAIPATRVFRQLMEHIGEGYDVDVELAAFDDTAKDDLLVSGSGLRGVSEYLGHCYPHGHLETSLEKFLQYCMVVYNYRMGVDYDRTHDRYTVRLLHHDDFYHESRIKKLESIGNVVFTIDRERLYTSIKCGYETRDDAINGLSEYNCVFRWLTPNTQIEGRELDLVCPYSASTRTIETYIYENYSNEKDSDEKDNEIFIIGASFKERTHSDIPDFANLPLIDIMGQRWDDTLVFNNNPATNGGHTWTSYVWYKNNFDEIYSEGYTNISGLNLSAGDIYYVVLTDSNGDVFLTMFPFDADYEIPFPEEQPITDMDCFEIRRKLMVTEGVAYPEYAWNIDFTPKRILMAHRRELNGCFAFNVGGRLTLNTCERNDALVSTKEAVLLSGIQHGLHTFTPVVGTFGDNDLVSENADVVIDDDRCFFPMLIQVETPMGKGMIGAIEGNRTGCFEFEYDGKTYKGFIAEGSDSVAVNPMNEKAGSLKLLMGKDGV